MSTQQTTKPAAPKPALKELSPDTLGHVQGGGIRFGSGSGPTSGG